MRKGKGLGREESRWKKGEERGENSIGKKTQLIYIIIHNYTQQHKFDQFLNFWWLLKTLPFADHGQVWHARVYTWSTVTCQISSVLVYYLEKPQILPHFELQQSVVAPPSGAETSCERFITTNLSLSNEIKSGVNQSGLSHTVGHVKKGHVTSS